MIEIDGVQYGWAVDLHKHLGWPRTDEQWHKYYLIMDEEFQTLKISPLHHDQRCPLCLKEKK